MTYFKPNIDAMAGYQPGEQPAPGAKVVKLNTNENPYPPSPKAMAVLKDFDPDLLRRYPHPMAQAAREAAARVWGLDPTWVLVGNGSDDLLTMLVRACAGPGRKVVVPGPTYVLYETLARIGDAGHVEVPFDEDYNLPAAGSAAAAGAITFVANPNSPSGTAAPALVLSELASRLKGVLVIDEAYVDFADGDALDVAREHENAIVLRTLSKGYSLAGLRLGFGLANPALLEGLVKVKDSYNVNALSCAVGAAALADQPHKIANAEKVKASRGKLAASLEALGFSVWPSQSNFLLARPADGQAGTLYEALKARGILVRYFDSDRLDDKLRITVGTNDDNAALVEALKELLSS